MPDEKTHADSLRYFLSGAASHSGVQTDPDASLGNHQSSSEEFGISWNEASPISNVTLVAVGGVNSTGTGTITAATADTLTWTAPGGSAGAQVTIANGETKILESGGGELEKFVRVTRTTADALAGSSSVVLTESVTTLVALDTVSSAEQTAGDDEYRALYIENVSTTTMSDITVRVKTLGTQRVTDSAQLGGAGAGTITTTGSFADWPDAGFALIKNNAGAEQEVVYYTSRSGTSLTVPAAGRGLALGDENGATAGAADDTVDAIPGMSIAVEAPGSQPSGNIQTIADEDTAPAATTFATPITVADALAIPNLATTEIQGIWIKRLIPAGATAGSGLSQQLRFAFDAA